MVPAKVIRPLRPQHTVVDLVGAQEVGDLAGGIFGFAQGQLLELFADVRPGGFELGRTATGEVSFDIAEQGGAGGAAVGVGLPENSSSASGRFPFSGSLSFSAVLGLGLPENR